MPKLQKYRAPRIDGLPVVYRAAGMDPAGAVDDDQRSFPIILASETPVRVYDYERGDIVDEVIEMAGVELPRQIPLLDTHDRSSVQHVLGSIRELRVDGQHLFGRAYFSSHPQAVQAYENYRDGHLTDFSIGAVAERVDWDGNTKRITSSKPLEGSAVVVGADPTAKITALRCYLEPDKVRQMALAEQLRRDFDVPDDVSDDQVAQWIKSNIGRAADDVEDEAEVDETAEIENVSSEGENDMAEQVEQAADLAAERQRVAQITEFCREHDWSTEDTNRAILEGRSVEWCGNRELQRRLDIQVNNEAAGASPVVTESAIDKFHAAATDGFRQRAFAGTHFGRLKAEAQNFRSFGLREQVDDLERSFNSPSAGARDFRYARFYDLARGYLETLGERNIASRPQHEVIRQAIRRGDEIARNAYHSTGSFSNLLLDASNKTLLMAYLESPSTWQLWARQAASAPDFKNINRIRLGELPDPDMVPENGTYPDKAVSDSRESYSVNKYGEIFSITLEAMVNDDLDAMARIPAMHGAAMRRKVNRSVYAILTDNAALSDGTELFAAGHSNTDTNALAASALNTGFTKMMVQAGLDSNTILNIMPRFLIVPPALAATAMQITGSLADPSNAAASTEDASRPNYNAGTLNLYGPNGPRQLVVVTDAYLSSSTSATTWFLAADSSQVDTVEVSFLQGEETPVLSREDGFDVDAVRFKCRQTWGTKAIDYRGLYRGNT